MLNTAIVKEALARLVPGAHAFDLSWSWTEGNVETRLLMGWNRGDVPFDPLIKLADQAQLPKAMVRRWFNEAQAVDVGLTVNQDVTSFRLYTHDWTDRALGAVVYRGFKALPDGTARIDEYVNCGDLRDSANLALARETAPWADLVAGIANDAPQDKPLMFTRIQNTGRSSWLVTVRHCNLDAGLITPELAGYKLAHLAGGMDATKGNFATAYVSTGPSSALEFLR